MTLAPAGSPLRTLRFLDGMVAAHTGAFADRSELCWDWRPGVGALGQFDLARSKP